MIQFEHVKKQYKNGFVAVDDLSLHIESGEFIVFIGPSGCGKTTTMKMINGLIEPTEGKILINGEDITRTNPYELRRKIGYVIQDIGLMPHMTIADNIACVPKLLKWDKERTSKRVRELLELVGLDPEITMGKYPKQLSGGQKQRVGVARALAVDPPIMLMDEPFGALDPITREQLQDEFIRLQKKMKKTIVFVTHDMDEAIKFADRIAIINHGKIVQCAPPLEILQKPANSFVSDFIGGDNIFKQLSLLQVKDLMKKDCCSADLEESVSGLYDKFSDENTDVLVWDEHKKICGYVKRSRALGVPGETKVKEICSGFSVMAGIHDTLKETLSKMIQKSTNHAGVVDENGKTVGIFTYDCFQKVVGKQMI